MLRQEGLRKIGHYKKSLSGNKRKKEKSRRKKYVNIRSRLDNYYIQRTEHRATGWAMNYFYLHYNHSLMCLEDLPGQNLSTYFAN